MSRVGQLCRDVPVDAPGRRCEDGFIRRAVVDWPEDTLALDRQLVLVVDDEPAMRDMLQRMLERAGYGVVCAADGAEGLARLDAGDVDLVLLDLMLPDLDGVEFCRQVRERQQERRVPIIMVTGSVNAADRRAGFAMGADDYVLKPFRTRALVDRVHAWTGRSAAEAPAPAPAEGQA